MSSSSTERSSPLCDASSSATQQTRDASLATCDPDTEIGMERDVPSESTEDEEARRRAEELEDGSLDPDELTDEPDWWDEGSDDET